MKSENSKGTGDFNINEFVQFAPDAVRAGMSVDQLARLLAFQLTHGEAEENSRDKE